MYNTYIYVLQIYVLYIQMQEKIKKLTQMIKFVEDGIN